MDERDNNPGKPSEENLLAGVTELSEEEEKEVSEEINNIMQSSRMEVSEDRLRPQSSRSGLFIPAIIIGVLLMFSGVFAGVAYAVFIEDQRGQVTRSQQSYDSQLIREILYQSNLRIQEKEEEIGNIRYQLSQVESSLNLLEEDFEEEIATRRRELEQQFRDDFANREQELLAQQYSPEEVERLLAEERRSRQRKIEEQLTALRADANERLLQRENDLRRVQAELSSTLTSRREEITLFEQQVSDQGRLFEEQREELLLTQQERAVLEQELEETSELEEDYQVLLHERETKQTLADQITMGITLAINDVTAGGEAANSGQLRTVLQDTETARLLGNRRVSTDIRVLDMVNSYRLLSDQLTALGQGENELEEIREALLFAQQEKATLQRQLEESTGVDEDYQVLLREQERKQALADQITAGITLAINDVTAGGQAANVDQLRAILQNTETAQLLGNKRVNTDIQVLDMISSYRLLDEQFAARQDTPLIVQEGENEDTQKLFQLRVDYLNSARIARGVIESQDIQELSRARNRLLDPIIATVDVFPDFGEIFFSLDDRIMTVREMSEQEIEDATRIQAMSDAEQVVKAALGTEGRVSVQPLLQRDQRLSQLYSLVGSSLNKRSGDASLRREYDDLLTKWTQQQQEIPVIQQQLAVLTTEYEEYQTTATQTQQRNKRLNIGAWTTAGVLGAILISFAIGIQVAGFE